MSESTKALTALRTAITALETAVKKDDATIVDLTAKLAAATKPPVVVPPPVVAPPPPPAGGGTTGIARYFQMTDSRHDWFLGTNDAGLRGRVLAAINAMGVYRPFFDDKLSWFPNAYVYLDSYAIYNGGPVASAHPEWILTDMNGNKLFIPFGCSGGSCPQFAGDIGNQMFRDFQVAAIKDAVIGHGYKGLFLDDVNMYMSRVGNGSGNAVAPRDWRTGQTMTEANWRKYFAEFCEQIRAALPGKEIIHNSIWYATRDNYGDQYSDRQIAAADYLFLEFGFGDGGIQGGNGVWSLDALLKYCDYVHSKGRALICDEKDGPDMLYGLACYYLIQNGRDMYGCMELSPDNWPAVLKADLGTAAGPRYRWNGLWRRDFAKGVVLVNEPGGAQFTTTGFSGYIDENGQTISSLTLGGKQGKVLRK